MRLDDAPEVLAADPKDALSLACRLRIKREALAGDKEDLEMMLHQIKKANPIFGAAWDRIRQNETEIPQLELQLKDLCRAGAHTLDLSSQGVKVEYANLMSESMSAERLETAFPAVAHACPDAIVVTRTVDVKVVKVAVAAGIIPQDVLLFIERKPTTSGGRVSLKYLSDVSEKP